MGELLALISAVNWALSTIFARRAQGKAKLDPMLGLFTTILVNNIINLAALAVRHVVWHPVPLDPAGVVFFFFGGTLNSFVGRGLLFISIAMIGAARAGITKSTMPIFVLFGGVFILGERLGPVTWLGISVVLVGLFLMSFDAARKGGVAGLNLNGKEASRFHLAKGIFFGIASAFFFGAGNISRKAGITLIPDTVLAVAICSFFALLTCVVVLLFQRKGRAMLVAAKNMEFNYAMSGLFTSGALYTLFMAMRHIPVSIANSITATETLFTILFVWLIKEGKKEKLGIRTILFGIVMVTGTIILIAG
ncbi:MAG: DMT family transporter [Treponema sp.]|nr:DMT family transporter [Treponema sp.]